MRQHFGECPAYQIRPLTRHLMSPEIRTLTDLALPISNPVLAWLADKFDDLKKRATTSKKKPSSDPVEDLRHVWDTHIAFGLAHAATFGLMATPQSVEMSEASAGGSMCCGNAYGASRKLVGYA